MAMTMILTMDDGTDARRMTVHVDDFADLDRIPAKKRLQISGAELIEHWDNPQDPRQGPTFDLRNGTDFPA